MGCAGGWKEGREEVRPEIEERREEFVEKAVMRTV
jgi:hypothetical protein